MTMKLFWGKEKDQLSFLKEGCRCRAAGMVSHCCLAALHELIWNGLTGARFRMWVKEVDRKWEEKAYYLA